MMEPSGSSYLPAPQPSLALVTAERSLRYWQEASYLLREMIVRAESTCELVQRCLNRAALPVPSVPALTSRLKVASAG